MQVEAHRVIQANFTFAEVIDALKRRYPDNFNIQCIPLVSKDGGMAPVVTLNGGVIKVSHTKVLRGVPPEGD